MKPMIQVFEYQRLMIGQPAIFTHQHWQALIRWNDQNGQRFFTPLHNGVQFKSYVGVLQIGNLTIEILPKTDRFTEEEDPKPWQTLLLHLLRVCRLLPVSTQAIANLCLQHHFLLDFFFEQFLIETENLIRKGLIKKYRYMVDNQPFMRGKIYFEKHIQKNIIHNTRFFTRFQTFDYDHALHHFLGQALQMVRQNASSQLIGRAQRLIEIFPPTLSTNSQQLDFQALILNRHTEHYRSSLQLAQLILMNQAPSMQRGNHPVFSILVDMNHLFEMYIFLKIKALEAEYPIKVNGQPSQKFWNHRLIRPDIVIESENENIVLDTKWKILTTASPSDEDLRQMYAYANFFKCKKSCLIYPQVFDNQQVIKGFFNQKDLTCDLYFAKVVQQQPNGDWQLNPYIGRDILSFLLSNAFKFSFDEHRI